MLQSLNPLRLLLFSALLAGGLLCLSAGPAAVRSDILVQLRADRIELTLVALRAIQVVHNRLLHKLVMWASR
jgi:hypothetical protein